MTAIPATQAPAGWSEDSDHHAILCASSPSGSTAKPEVLENPGPSSTGGRSRGEDRKVDAMRRGVCARGWAKNGRGTRALRHRARRAPLMTTLLEVLLSLVALPLSLANAYLLSLTLLSRRLPTVASKAAPALRFAVVVPAHDEQGDWPHGAQLARDRLPERALLRRGGRRQLHR